MANKNLTRAKREKNDEFYTRLSDIENELIHYRKHFKGKVIFLNCDDPYESNFWFYFHKQFEFLGLKKLIATHYVKGERSFKLEYMGGDDNDIYSGIKTDLKGDGDFRSDECIDLLKECDIIVTNPMFSLFREYVACLVKYEKDFLIIGNQNAITYKELFPLLKDEKMWLGYKSGAMSFYVPDREEYKKSSSFYIDEDGRNCRKFGNICWFTNLDIDKRHENIPLAKFYENDPSYYPKYDNYDVIEVSRVNEIPMDYEGVMGVPITFLHKFNPDQFEILGSQRWCKSQEVIDLYRGDKEKCENDKKTLINGKETYDRIFIKNRNPISKKDFLGGNI